MAGSQAQRIADALRKRVEGSCRVLALEIDKELRRGTPVVTGHARRNWVPSVGAPNVTEAVNESAHAAGIAAVLAFKLGEGSLWVANAVPYIRSLNYGHSKQQPAGFVERAIALGLQAAEKKGVDVSSMRESFANRNAGASQGASPDAADTTSGGGEY